MIFAVLERARGWRDTWRASGRTRYRAAVKRHLLAACLLTACAHHAEPAPTGPSLVIRGARVFDGEKLLPPTDVLVRGGRIAKLGGTMPSTAELVDGHGATLLPGLIDAHAHVFDKEALALSAIFGVTTVLDMGCGDPKIGAALKIAAEQPGSGLANLRFAGYAVTVAGGHCTEYGFPVPTLASAGDAKAFIDARIGDGADYVKLILDDGSELGHPLPTLSAEMLNAAVAAVHSHHALAVVHIGSQAGASEVVASGADGLAHTFEDSAPRKEVIDAIAARHMFVTPTLSVNHAAAHESNAQVASDPHLAPFLDADARAQLGKGFGRVFPLLQYANAEASVRALRDAHVRLLAGTDSPNPGTLYGASLHGELELLVRAGLTPTEALVAATSAPAAQFSLPDRGRIRVGARADLVLVHGDPTTDILATRDIALVLIGGVRVDRKLAPPPATRAAGPIADFEEGVVFHASTDAIAGGKSTATLAIVPGAHGSKGALHVAGEVAPGLAYAWSGAMWEPGDAPLAAVDLSSTHGLSFLARGDGATYRVMVFTKRRGRFPSIKTFVAGPAWTPVRLAWSDFDGSDGSDVFGIAIVAGPAPGAFALELDDVALD